MTEPVLRPLVQAAQELANDARAMQLGHPWADPLLRELAAFLEEWRTRAERNGAKQP